MHVITAQAVIALLRRHERISGMSEIRIYVSDG